MGLFDSLKNSLVSSAKQTARTSVTKAVNQATTNASNSINKAIHTSKKSFTFNYIPTSLAELQALPGAADLKDYSAVAALSVMALAAYGQNKEAGTEMFNYLMGPNDLSGLDTQRYDMLFKAGKAYIPMSYFEGATVQNNYTPNQPYKITIEEGVHSRDCFNEGYLTLYVQSAGADSPRIIKLRTKPSTGQWFLNDLQGVLSDIRTPVAADPWA